MSSSPPLFSSSADPELPPTQLHLSQRIPSTPPAFPSQDSPAPVIPVSPSENPSSTVPAPLPEPDSDDDDESAAPPITLSASVVLTNIPRDSRVALANAFMPSTAKVTIRLLSVGSTPSLRKNRFTVTASKRFSVVVHFLRNKLNLDSNGQSLFVYVNSTFAPSLDEEVGNLYNSFKRESELVVNYCLTPAFG